MIQTPKTGDAFQADILTSLQSTGIRQTAAGGKARAFGDIVGDQLGQLEAGNFTAMMQTLLPYAAGDNLDFLGQMAGVFRIGRQDSSVAVADNNFQFYVTRGTFGDINSGQDILVPAGTRISSPASNGPIYLTDFAVTLGAGASSQAFTATSLAVGSSGNAPAGVFNQHNFTHYSSSPFGSLLVTNNYGIVEGRDAEDDSSYRYRISLKLQSTGGAGEDDIRGAILQVPGVQDVILERQAGTFLAYVYGISPVVPPSLMQLVQQQINQTVAFPLTGTAVAPDLVGISLETTISFKSGLSATDQQAIMVTASQAAQGYINNLAIGQTLVLNQIADVIQSSDTRILDIGSPDRPLNEIFIWRSRLDGSRYSRFLVANYEPATGERIVVENIPSAVSLTAA